MIESSRCREGSGSGSEWKRFFSHSVAGIRPCIRKVAAVSLHSVALALASTVHTYRSSYCAHLVA